ncbi:hypothetical protein FR932_04840 [Moritella marina ATCC 15381]|uniref:Uncharacterized protein n=1 Tax=Moritella marina ATCC 15381 TaxID=1202962 RepID=A0A5J6WGL8_MORMI|nr:hypothetical protein [Moritella marina]QFI37199.1 hypothetical protein FR932_04840 [Moritella marina ATCC 15381]
MMRVIKLILITAFSTIVIGCSNSSKSEMTTVTEDTILAATEVKPQICTHAWYSEIDSQLITGDGQGHGPDLGSQEWRSVIEFKLGIRGDANVPARHSTLWCDYINRLSTTR